MTTSRAPARFDAAALRGLDEPVRRYFTHAIRDGAPLPDALCLTMAGRIRAGLWMPFAARQEIDGRSFRWRARVGVGPLTLLRVMDRYADGAGSVEGRLFGRIPLFRAADANTARSAAARTALEGVLAPPAVLPERGVTWRAEGEHLIVGTFDLPPERPEVHVCIDEAGAVRSVSALRWGDVGGKRFDYIPCGCEIHAERRFGDLVIPSSLSVGWWFGTPRYAPFFRAEIRAVAPLDEAAENPRRTR